MGDIDTTESGKECLSWTHNYTSVTSYLSLKNNYCRKISKHDLKPWCYVTSTGSWEYCNVPICNANNEIRKHGINVLELSFIISVSVIVIIIILLIIIKCWCLRKNKMVDSVVIHPYDELLIDNESIATLHEIGEQMQCM